MAKPFDGWVDDPEVIAYAVERATGWDKFYLSLYLGEVLGRVKERTGNDEQEVHQRTQHGGG